MSKTERVELRISPDDKSAIAEAAAMERISPTEFMRQAILDRAQRLHARADRTFMPAEQFDALVASLDVPEATPNLARAFAHKRRFVQR